MKVELNLNGWQHLSDKNCDFYYKGNFIYNNEVVSPKFIFDEICKINENIFENIDGFFSFIYVEQDKLIACSDLIRSIPLFYSYDENKNLEFSSKLESNTNFEYNEDNKELFRLSSYVLGNETLYNNVKQLTAGKYLIFDGKVLEEIQYFRFNSIKPKSFDIVDFEDGLNKIVKDSFRKLIDFAKGRQIVVPLSGGYDSRLIVSVLKEENYSNVICFSYGLKGNLEAEYSKRIAESLGFEWLFVEYTPEKWIENWEGELSKKYVNFASNKVSLPHIQDWIAVLELKNKKLVENNAIFVPGHCCVTGYINKHLVNIPATKNNFLNIIINQHYALCPIKETKIKNKKNLMNLLDTKLSKYLDLNSDICSNVMEFNWRERQSKYISNSVRVYEFFGYDWWMPLWDKEFMNCWIHVPNELRIDRHFFKKWVSKKYTLQSGVDFDLGNARAPSLIYRVVSIILKKCPQIIKDGIKKLYRKNEYKKHHLGFGAIVSESERDTLTKKGYKILGIYTKKYLGGEWGE